MMLVEPFTGYGKSKGRITRVTNYNKIFDKNFQIFFYSGNSFSVIDLFPGESDNDFVVGYYPTKTNGQSLFEQISKKEAELAGLFTRLMREKKADAISIFSVDLETLKVLDKGDFIEFSPRLTRNRQLFTLEASEAEGGFPFLYLMEETSNREDDINILCAQAFSSHALPPPASGKVTELGKRLVFQLVVSEQRSKNDVPTPYMTNSGFPTNKALGHLPVYLNTEALVKFATECGADKIINRGGKNVDESTVTEAPNPFETEDEIREKQMRKDHLEKGAISMTDVLLQGVSETIHMFDTYVRPIKIDLNIAAEKLKKACLYVGFMYILPLKNDDETDWESYLTDDDGHIVVCTEDSYPIGLDLQLPASSSAAG